MARIRTPRQGEVFGLVEMMLGADKIRARCDDGNTRVCRIPGRLRKRVWIKGTIVESYFGLKGINSVTDYAIE